MDVRDRLGTQEPCDSAVYVSDARERFEGGNVELQEHRLTVGPNGKLKASVKARELVVLGTIHGDCETIDKIDIRREAKLVGDIKTARIVIEPRPVR